MVCFDYGTAGWVFVLLKKMVFWIVSFVRHSWLFVSICVLLKCHRSFWVWRMSFPFWNHVILLFAYGVSLSGSCKDLLLEIWRVGWNPTRESKAWQIKENDEYSYIMYITSKHKNWKDIQKLWCGIQHMLCWKHLRTIKKTLRNTKVSRNINKLPTLLQ